MQLAAFVLLLLGVHLRSALSDPPEISREYRFSATLDREGQYVLYWNYDLSAQSISFAVRVQTTGWVGFGLSPNGGMPGSDVVIGWVTEDDQVFFHDRYAERKQLPPIDETQNWFLINADEEDGYTTLRFWRNLTSCDVEDLNIEEDTARIVWSWNSLDPQNIHSINQHEFRGTTSVNLLGGLNEDRRDPPDHAAFNITVDNVTIPHDSDTTYWCAAFRLPPEIREEERFIYKVVPLISEHSFQYVHHMLIYLCDYLEPTDIGSSTPCDNATPAVSSCRGIRTFGAWAVGGSDIVYPENVAYPIGGPNRSDLVVIEMHYDNPRLDPGVPDSSGFEFFYTSVPPEKRAGILALGHAVTNIMIIPPNAENYTVSGLCSAGCLEPFIPPEGINVFANILHTHLAGHGLVLRHFQPNEECDVLEELQPIDSNLKYDFNFQEFTILPKEVKILPGDTIQLDCFYRTTEYSRLTLGGESTREEMCFAFMIYYPQIDLDVCASIPLPNAFIPFANEHVMPSDRGPLLGSVESFNETGIRNVLDDISWTPSAIDSLQNSVLSSDILSFCIADARAPQDSRNMFFPDAYPTPECPYESPNNCTGFQPLPCCERLARNAPSSATIETALSLLFVAVVAFCASLFQ